MTLLISVFAAVICTALWYKNSPKNNMCYGFLCWLFWGASLMWLVDAVYEYAELGAEYFEPSLADMVNDTFLGLSVVALALCAWVVFLLIKDPKGVVKAALFKKQQSDK